MAAHELDLAIDRLLPAVLADRELGDGRAFTTLHLNRLWALTCLQTGECYDRELLVRRIQTLLPKSVRLAPNLYA